jgi:hypothetical protein
VTILNNSLSIDDGALGIAAAGQRPVAVVGCCSSGTVGAPTTIDTLDGLTDTFGFGPAVEDAAEILSAAGGSILFCRATTATAGAIGGLCQSGGGGSSAGTLAADGSNTATAVPVLTGTPDAPYAVKIVVTTAGSNIAATPVVKISLDGGLTYLATGLVAVSASPQAIGSTGLSLAWTDGTFVLSNFWSSVGANCPTSADATGTSVPAFSGTPNDVYDIRVKTMAASSALTDNTAAVAVSIDGGNTYGDTVAIPSSGVYVIPNTGVTVTFGAGTHVVGDIFRVKTSSPTWDTSGLSSALNALAPMAGAYEFAHIAGPIDVTSAATVKTWAVAREAAGEYVFAQCSARDNITGESNTTRNAAIAGSTPGFSGYDGGRYLDVHASYANVESVTHAGSYPRRSLAALRSARLAKEPPHRHPGRVRSGRIEGLMPDPDGGSSLAHDVSTYTSLDTARFSGAQRVMGQARGRYFFTSRTMALATSDFSEVQRIRVMCVAATAALSQMSTYVADDIDVKSDGTGQITEAEGQRIDGEIKAVMKRAVVLTPNAYASAVNASVIRTNNLLSTGILQARISVTPKGSVNSVSTTISYTLGG